MTAHLTTSHYHLANQGAPAGLEIIERGTMRRAVLDAQAATELLMLADRLCAMTLSDSTSNKALNWLIESYL